MSSTFDKQIDQLKQTIAEMESQRAILGDETIEAALVPLHKKLAELESQVKPFVDKPQELPTRQRKLVTLLYMDVVGSTAMTQHLDPEDNLEIMESALLRLVEPVQEHGGRVTRYTGDGFKTVFGDPVATEYDPEPAIRAGLEILDVSKAVAQEIEKEWAVEDFQVRIGIDTGLAALGGQTEAEDTVKGQVVNLAKRIESAAPSGGLLISHNTYRHVRGVFNVEPQESILAKGFPEPVPVYLVKEIKPRTFRVHTRGVEGVETRMVSRETELKLLQDTLLTAIEESEGQVITITGEAGVGKSRLLYEFDNWIELLPLPYVCFFQGQGRQESQGLPYSLLRDVFAFRFQILDDDTGEQARRKIESGFREVFGHEEDATMRAHILGQLLGFDFSASPHLKGVLNDPEQLRNRGLMYLKEYFQILSQESPIVILLEDIHWGDESSLDVVSQLGNYSSQLPLVIACAARPILFELRPYWGEGQTYHTRIELRPLSKRESRQLVAEILKFALDIPTELRELIVKGAEGNPFYTEELIKMLIEDGVVIPDEEVWQIELTRLEEVDVPSTLAGVLQARLDSLPQHERTVLQQASVVGRLFWDRIVAYIQAEGGSRGDPALIPQTLTSLRNRELVFRHEESAFVGSVEYLFKHDVLREVTYESVVKRLRKTYHGLVADWLIAYTGDRINEYNGLIAEHLLLAERKDQACEYFKMAGESALDSYSPSEAEGYYRKALDLSSDDILHADVLFGLGEALSRKGNTERSVNIWQQAIDSYHRLGEYEQMAEAFARLSGVVWHNQEYLEAWKVCKEGLDMMEGSSDTPGYAHLLAEAGRVACFQNESEQTLLLCKKAITMAERLGEMEVSADARITLAMQEENITRSIVILKEVIELAIENDLLQTLVRANGNLSAMFLGILDPANSVEYSKQAIELGEQIGTNTLYGVSNLVHAYTQLGKIDEAENVLMSTISVNNDRLKEKEIISLLNQGRILYARGDWCKSLEVLQDCLDLLHQEGSIQLIGNCNLEYVNSALELNRFGIHCDLHKAELALRKNIHLKHELSETYLLLVIMFARTSRIQKAHDYVLQAEKLIINEEDIGARNSRAFAMYEIAYADECWRDAVDVIEYAIDIYQRSSHRWGLARRLIDLGAALVGRNEPGDLERAREIYQQSLDMFTEMAAPGYIKVLEERLGDM